MHTKLFSSCHYPFVECGSTPPPSPQIIAFNHKDAPELFAQSLHQTGFAIISVANGELGIYQSQINAAREENIAYLNKPFAEKFPSLFLNDLYKDAGWFPLGAEGRTGGESNLVEYLHHRGNRRNVDFQGHTFENTWHLFKGMQRLNDKLTSWLIQELPTGHAAHETLHRLSTQMDGTMRSIVRFLKYYPHHPLKPEVLPAFDETGKIRLWNDPHEDGGWLTLIPMQSKPGLQLMSTQGQWYNVPWVEEKDRDPNRIMIVVNAGDILSAASGGKFALCLSKKREDGTVDKLHNPLTFEHHRDAQGPLHMWRDGWYYTNHRLRLIKQGHYPSTTHRVIAGNEIRYSMPFFFHLNGWAEIGDGWIAYDKMRGYVRNKEAQREQALAAMYSANNIPPPR